MPSKQPQNGYTNSVNETFDLSYNNSVHSVTKFTPFEIIKGRIDNPDPFDLKDSLVVSHYVQEHKEINKKLYKQIQDRNEVVKRAIIERNQNREEQPIYSEQKTAYVKTKLRDKKLPEFEERRQRSNNKN